MLRGVRLAAGLSEALIQQELGITATLLRALEADDHGRLPAEVFVKGYLRRYAQLVGARPAAVLAAYQQSLEAEGLVTLPVQEVANPRPVKLMIGAAAGMLLATSVVFGAMLVDGGGVQVEDGRPPVAVAPARASRENAAPSLPAENRLTLEFASESWVEIIDAREHILAVSLQRAGDRLELEGMPPFRITLGNGRAVTLSYLGKPVALKPDPETHAVSLSLGSAITE